MSPASETTALRGAAAAGAALALFFSVVAVRSPLATALRRGEPVEGILLGTDLAENAPHSDTLMLWRYNPQQTKLNVLSIPRDTKIDLPGYRFRRINEVFAYHYAAQRNVPAAVHPVMDAVTQLLPSGGALQPRNFFQVDYQGFRRMIDRLGGVTVAVDEPMHYDDRAGNFHFHKDPGVYRLNGTEALGYVRFRGKSGDRGRILRQMEFLRSLLKLTTSPTVFWRWPRALSEAAWALHTNVRAFELPFLFVEGKRMRGPDINPWLLPGRPRGAYWEMDKDRAAYVIQQILKGETAAPAAASEGEDLPAAGTEPAAPEAGRAPTVKVWNASGRPGLALAVTRRLRREGFDVIDWGNYSGRQNKSRVVDRSGHFDRARRVADRLGLLGAYSDADPALRTDVEVVLGEDFTGSEE